MVTKRVLRVVAVVLLSFLAIPLFGVVKGSDSSVSVESNYTFPSVDTDNKILGFGWFKNGFSLEDAATTCTFDSVYPVSGTVDLNGGTIYLNQDLIFKNITTLSGAGSVLGNGHIIELCESIESFPANTDTFENTHIYLATDLTLNSTITFKGNCSLHGNGSLLFLGDSGALVVDSDSHLELQGLEIEEIKGENIQCIDDTASITLADVHMIQGADYSFKSGSIAFHGLVSWLGAYTFNYDSAFTSTINNNTTLHITDGLHFCIGRDQQTGSEPLVFEDATSVLRLDSCTFIISGSGATLSKGTIALDRDIDVEVVSTTTSNGLILGDGNEGGDITINVSPSAIVNLRNGYLVFNNVDSSKFISTSHSARIARHLDSLVYFAQDTVLNEVSLELVSNLIAPLEVADGKVLTFNRTRIVLPDTEFDLTGRQYSSYAYALNGEDEFFLAKGSLPLGLVVTGTGNKLHGNGGVVQQVTLAGATSELEVAMNGFVNNNVVLNGGKLTLSSDLEFLANGAIVGPGTVSLDSSVLDVCGGMRDASSNLYFEGNDAVISLHSNIALSATWTFSGNITLNGNGNKVDLGSTGQIFIDSGADVTFKNMRLSGIDGTNLQCVDDTAHFNLDDVSWIQDGTFTFTTGSFDVNHRVSFLGTSTFQYSSRLTSTIKSGAELRFSDGMYLVAGRHEETMNEPIELEDSTSVMRLDNCTFHITSSGLRLTKGQLFLDRNIDLITDSDSKEVGFEVGNGNSVDDLEIYMSPSCVVSFKKGHVIYNNGMPNGFVSASKTVRFIRSIGAHFYVDQDLTFKNVTSELASDFVTAIVVADGKTLAFDPIGVAFPGANFDIKGTQLSGTTFQLTTNDYISMSRGDFPLAVLIAGSGNVIRGNGRLLSPVVFLASSSQLSWSALGSIANDITLAGGILNLDNDLFLANSGVIIGPGTVDMSNRRLRLPAQSTTWNTPIYWEGSESLIDLKAPVTLSSTWTFSGYCTIDGRRNTLRIADGGQLVVAEDSTLHMKDITLEDLSATKIHCLGDNSLICLDNVLWKQSADMQFTTGALQFINQVKMKGAHSVFAYQSVQTSTVHSDSYLKLDTGFTFSYDPLGSASANLIEFSNEEDSQLILDSATLHATTTGMALLGGNLVIKGSATLSSEIGSTGITVGDGDSADDMSVTLLVGSELFVESGSMRYKNVLPSSFVARNNLSHIRVNSGAILHVHQSLNLGLGNIIFENNGQLDKAIGASITGPLIPKGQFFRTQFVDA